MFHFVVQIFTLLNVAPSPPYTCTLCCYIMLVTDLPNSIGTVTYGHGHYCTLLQSLEEKDKQKFF
jgi:hypothetical protein